MKRFLNYVGIDVSKLTLDIVIHRIHLGQNSPHLKTENSQKGYKEIISWLNNNSAKPEETLFCLEYTGIYSQRLSAFFDKKSLSYSLVSPLHMKRSMGFIRGKNDKADALVKTDAIKYSYTPFTSF